MEYLEEVGESSSPLHSYSSFSGTGSAGGVNDAIRKEVYDRLIEIGNEEAISDPDFHEKLEAHFNCLPQSYGSDINMERVEDVLLHQKLLARARDSDIPVFHIRLSENICSRDDFDTEGDPDATPFPHGNVIEDVNALCDRNHERDVEACSKLEDLNLGVRNNDDGISKPLAEGSRGVEASNAPPIHEIIFSTTDKPKLLCQLSALLSDIGLNIREAHVFSTTDGYSLDVFVVDGWVEDIEGLYDAVNNAIKRSRPGPSNSSMIPEKAISNETSHEEWEINLGQLKIGEKVASGSSGDLHLGVYHGKEVAVKILRPEHLNTSAQGEFSQEIAILRHIQHRNVIEFIGAYTKLPHLLIVTEYMSGGSLYDYLRKNHRKLKFPQLLRFAIDASKGMEYLHQKSIIHRDLKTANLLLDASNVVKVADFGIARFQNKGGVMTAETGTYRWMAPEVINHQPYDHKADVFSFGIVLWELLTAKVPYDNMSPVQAALGVRKGLRPEPPNDVDPKLLRLMQRCWEEVPSHRPSFTEIRIQLEELLHEVESATESPQVSHQTSEMPSSC